MTSILVYLCHSGYDAESTIIINILPYYLKHFMKKGIFHNCIYLFVNILSFLLILLFYIVPGEVLKLIFIYLLIMKLSGYLMLFLSCLMIIIRIKVEWFKGILLTNVVLVIVISILFQFSIFTQYYW